MSRETATRDLKILGIFRHEFLLESITRRHVHHVINKLAVNDNVVSFALHENCLGIINRWG
jgi:hypothetical protein